MSLLYAHPHSAIFGRFRHINASRNYDSKAILLITDSEHYRRDKDRVNTVLKPYRVLTHPTTAFIFASGDDVQDALDSIGAQPEDCLLVLLSPFCHDKDAVLLDVHRRWKTPRVPHLSLSNEEGFVIHYVGQ